MIAKFFRNLKMKMLLAQTKQELINLSSAEKAYVLLMWAEFISDLNENLPASRAYLEVLLEPEECPDFACYQAYCELETLKLYADKSLKQNKKNMQEWGIDKALGFDSMKLRYCSILRGMALLVGFIDQNQQSKSQDIKNMFSTLIEKDFDEAVVHYQDLIDFEIKMDAKQKGDEKNYPAKDLKELAISFL